MKFGAVFILYNFNKSFLDNLNSIKSNIDFIVLIDNSSTSSEHIFKNYISEKLNYIPLYKNTGIATALNKGMNICIEEKCDWIFTFDQDSRFFNNNVQIFREFIEKNTNGNIIGLCPQYITYQNSPKIEGTTENIVEVIQSGTAFNAKKYLEIGPFKEKYFIDYVDYEYGYRAERNGYKFIRCNDAMLIHNMDDDIFNENYKYYKKIKIFKYVHHYVYPSELRTYYVFRNGLDVFFEYKKLRVIVSLLSRILKCILFEKNKLQQIRAMGKGTADFIFKRYGCIDKF